LPNNNFKKKIVKVTAAVAFNTMKRLRQIRDAIYFVTGLPTGNRQVKNVTMLIYLKTKLVRSRVFTAKD
jgi:hypothetical protein